MNKCLRMENFGLKILFCSVCRLSGVGEGADFGSVQTVFGEECSPWRGESYLAPGSANCANPSRSISGPWCYVSSGEKQPCDVPICEFSGQRASLFFSPLLNHLGEICYFFNFLEILIMSLFVIFDFIFHVLYHCWF